MKIEFFNRPGNTIAMVHLEGGEKIISEAGAMLAMSSNITLETSTKTKKGGGILKGLKRTLAGESMFLNIYTAPPEGGNIIFSSQFPGDMISYDLKEGKELIVQATSFVACGEDVDMDISWQGFKSLFSGESLFWLKFTGKGYIILDSFGGIYEKDVDGEYIVDTGHIVAFESTLKFKIRKAARSWFSSIMGGEGLACKFEGKGKLYCQTHNPYNFGRILGPLLPPKRE